ncbi:MAG: D-glycero-alpha-D-manno-heptose-1,7-bisphosphate 7-phosphatase [Kiritimatiellia bacterium]
MNFPSGFFLDRDGLINVPPPNEQRYILHPDEFELLPGIAEAVRLLNLRSIPVAVVTNQKGIALGRLSLSALERIHERMQELLAAEGAFLQNIQFCPHREEDQCACRKPLPGLIFQAANALRIDPEKAWMVGDQFRDLEAGRSAGCSTLLVGPHQPPPGLADDHLPNTEALPRWLEENFPFHPER